MFVWVKPLHVVCALVSVGFFVVRALWMLQGSPRLRDLWVRVAPHVIDTVLFLSGIYLATLWNWATWIWIKLAGVVLYIILGWIALRPSFNATTKRMALGGAFAAVAFVFMVAMVGRVF